MAKTTKKPKKTTPPTWRVGAIVDVRGHMIALDVWTVCGADPKDPDKTYLESGDLLFPSEKLAQDFIDERLPKRLRPHFRVSQVFVPMRPLGRLVKWA